MQGINNHLKHAIIKACVFCLLILLDFGFLYVDAHFVTVDLTENSFTEWAAETQLMLMIGMLIFMKKPGGRNQSFMALLAGCMLILLIREFNNFFKDHVFEGSCTLLMLVAAAAAVYFSYKQRAELLTGVNQFVKSPGYGWFISGAVVVFIFSRLFALPILWQLILKGNYVRIVERFIEEGIELMAYSCMLTGIVEYVLHLKKKSAVTYVNRNEKKSLTVIRGELMPA